MKNLACMRQIAGLGLTLNAQHLEPKPQSTLSLVPLFSKIIRFWNSPLMLVQMQVKEAHYDIGYHSSTSATILNDDLSAANCYWEWLYCD